MNEWMKGRMNTFNFSYFILQFFLLIFDFVNVINSLVNYTIIINSQTTVWKTLI